jgi:hypothetical protein
MGTLRRILLVLVLCGLGLGYLYQHYWSMRLTRRVAQLTKERQLLVERRDRLDIEIVRLSSFERLESLWVAAGRPGEIAAVAAHPGVGDWFVAFDCSTAVRHAQLVLGQRRPAGQKELAGVRLAGAR